MINVSRPFNIYQIIWKAKIYFDNSNLITNYEIKQLDVITVSQATEFSTPLHSF